MPEELAIAQAWTPAGWLMMSSALTLTASGFAAFAAKSDRRLAGRIGMWGAAAGSALGFVPSFMIFAGVAEMPVRIFDWRLPFGQFMVGADTLSALFLMPLFALCGLCAVYSSGYMRLCHEGHGGEDGGREGSYWLLYNLLAAAMAMTLLARDGMLFLVAWEMMSVASFGLVAFEHGEEMSRRAAWTYLVAAHFGTGLLVALFILLGRATESMSFGALCADGAWMPSACFLLALGGFGLKAGLVPLHVWLPEAHPAAPAPVSAIMSGIMIKLGVYGILRTLCILWEPCAWWGWALLAVGLLSTLSGILSAIPQGSLKRLLAYSSVENAGIIASGLGIGLIGMSQGNEIMAALGCGGALLHVLNHSVFKPLLFLCAGALQTGAGTVELDRMGGLLKRMPRTGWCMLCGSVSISGLPPMNGFLSEFLIYFAAFAGMLSGGACLAAGLATALTLCLAGTLASAAFVKASGTSLLGEPRTEEAASAKEAPPSMTLPMMSLAGMCAILALGASFSLCLLTPAIASILDMPPETVFAQTRLVLRPLMMIGVMSCAIFAVVSALSILRGVLPRGREESAAGTWDCGYAKPSARMQYSASSLIQPIRDLFCFASKTVEDTETPKGCLPKNRCHYSSCMVDMFMSSVFEPCFKLAARLCGRAHALQSGHLHLYLLLMVGALMLMLLWGYMTGGDAK